MKAFIFRPLFTVKSSILVNILISIPISHNSPKMKLLVPGHIIYILTVETISDLKLNLKKKNIAHPVRFVKRVISEFHVKANDSDGFKSSPSHSREK